MNIRGFMAREVRRRKQIDVANLLNVSWLDFVD